MESPRETKNRIKSIKKTQQITRTMQMVAASRLKKAEVRLKMVRPYSLAMEAFLNRLVLDASPFASPLFEKREEKHITVVLVTADRGLCAAFNVNMMQKAVELFTDYEKQNVSIIAVGKRGRDYFRKMGYNILATYPSEIIDADAPVVAEIADKTVGAFLEKKTDAVYMIYSSFISAMKNQPEISKLLSLEPPETTGDGNNSGEVDYIFEPDKSEILDNFLPVFVKLKIYRGLMESYTSENGARMLAMKSATDNAKEMIDTLTTRMNKARQAAITREIVEIVTAGEALKA